VLLACGGNAPARPESSPFGGPRVVHRVEGAFGEIAVVDEGRLRHLRFGGPNGVAQTTIDRDDPDRVPMAYLQAAALGPFLAESPRSALIVGLGGGGFSRFLARRFPGLRIDAVEIDPVVVEVGREFFEVREGPGLTIHLDDGAAYLETLRAAGARDRYDVILLDAYTGAQVPAHLATVEFFERVHEQLAPGGVVVANVGLETLEEEERLLRRFSRVFRAGCLEVRPHEGDNRIALGARRALPERERLLGLARAADARERLAFSLEIIARSGRPCPTASTGPSREGSGVLGSGTGGGPAGRAPPG
jgi:spermidine synthase